MMAFDKPERLRFTINDDLTLLREVIAANPYQDICQWRQVHEKTVLATGKGYSLRAIKEHVIHLLKLWRKDDISNLRKSGTEEQYEEKEQLLQSISQMSSESGTRKRGLDEPLDSDNKAFSFNYDPAFSDSQTEQVSHDPNSQQATNTRKRMCKENTIKSSLVKYLNKRQEEQSSLKMKELQIEEVKLDVEKKKIELEERRIKLEEAKWRIEEKERQAKLDADIAERKQRLAIEMEERKQRLRQNEGQQKLMELMFNFFTKNSV